MPGVPVAAGEPGLASDRAELSYPLFTDEADEFGPVTDEAPLGALRSLLLPVALEPFADPLLEELYGRFELMLEPFVPDVELEDCA